MQSFSAVPERHSMTNQPFSLPHSGSCLAGKVQMVLKGRDEKSSNCNDSRYATDRC